MARATGKRFTKKRVTFDEWMAEGGRFATREEVVAFSNLQIREQIMPLIGEAIKAYDVEQRRRRHEGRWYRRLWRGLRKLFSPVAVNVKDLPSDALEELQRQLEEAKAEIAAEEAEPHFKPGPKRTCVTCGSSQLQPVNALGGLQCENGHVLEDPPNNGPGPWTPEELDRMKKEESHDAT